MLKLKSEVTISPEFMPKNQKPTHTNDPWFIPAVHTGKPQFAVPLCCVSVLRYCHPCMKDHPDLRKGRRHLFIPIKYNNFFKQLSAATISWWICNTMEQPHSAPYDSKCLPRTIKAVRSAPSLPHCNCFQRWICRLY